MKHVILTDIKILHCALKLLLYSVPTEKSSSGLRCLTYMGFILFTSLKDVKQKKTRIP